MLSKEQNQTRQSHRERGVFCHEAVICYLAPLQIIKVYLLKGNTDHPTSIAIVLWELSVF